MFLSKLTITRRDYVLDQATQVHERLEGCKYGGREFSDRSARPLVLGAIVYLVA